MILVNNQTEGNYPLCSVVLSEVKDGYAENKKR